MLTREFRIDRNADYDLIGLCPLWLPAHQRDVLGSMGIAHDVLEHGDTDICEWQGLGGTVYVRVLGGYFQQSRGNQDPVENVASEFINLYHLWEGQDIPAPRRTRPVDEQAEQYIQEIVQRGVRVTRMEIGRDTSDDEVEQVRRWTRPTQQARMVGWMRKGYRATARRWADYSSYHMTFMFQRLEQRLETFLKDHQDYIGAAVTLRLDLQAETIHLSLPDLDDDDPNND